MGRLQGFNRESRGLAHSPVTSARRLGAQPMEVLPGVNARPVSVRPAGLEAVASHQAVGRHLERLCHQRLGLRSMYDSQDVRLTLAVRARATAAQTFQRDEVLPSVGPFDGEFRADDGEIVRSHADSMPRLVQVSTPLDLRSISWRSHAP